MTLGSLLREDLQDLEEMGLIPDESDDEDDKDKEKAGSAPTPNRSAVLRQSYGVPWFDGMVEGTRLGNMRRSHGIRKSEDGSVSVEWEIIEYSDGSGNSQDDEDIDMPTPSSNSKRKLDDRDEGDVEAA